jgi:hypothetical protein
VDIDEARGDLAIGLDHVDQLNGVIVAITQVEPRLRADERRLVAQQGVEQVAQRPDRPAHRQQVALQVVDARDLADLGLLDDHALELLDLLAAALEQGKVGVNRGVDQRVCKVVGASLANGAGGGTEPPPDRLEDVGVRPLLEGKHQATAEADRHQFELEPPGCDVIRMVPVTSGKAKDDKQGVVVSLELRPLVDIENVLERQRVQAERRADRPDGLHISQSLDVDPCDRVFACGRQRSRRVDLTLDEASGAEQGRVDPRKGRSGIGCKRPRRRARRRAPTPLARSPSVLPRLLFTLHHGFRLRRRTTRHRLGKAVVGADQCILRHLPRRRDRLDAGRRLSEAIDLVLLAGISEPGGALLDQVPEDRRADEVAREGPADCAARLLERLLPVCHLDVAAADRGALPEARPAGRRSALQSPR